MSKKKHPQRLSQKIEKTRISESRSGIPLEGQKLRDLIELQGLDLDETSKKLEALDKNARQMEAIIRQCQLLAKEAAQSSTSDARRVELQAQADILRDRYNALARNTDFSFTRKLQAAISRHNN